MIHRSSPRQPTVVCDANDGRHLLSRGTFAAKWRYLLGLIVIAQLCNTNCTIHNFVNNTVLSVDSPRPVTSQRMFEWLWFANSRKWAARNVFNQLVNASNDFAICCLPMKIIFPSLGGKCDIHVPNSRG